jgi:hypothetical protein
MVRLQMRQLNSDNRSWMAVVSTTVVADVKRIMVATPPSTIAAMNMPGRRTTSTPRCPRRNTISSGMIDTNGAAKTTTEARGYTSRARCCSRNSGCTYVSVCGWVVVTIASNQPAVRRGTLIRAAAEPVVWLWPTCFWNAFPFCTPGPCVLSSSESIVALCGLFSPLFICLNSELSGLPEGVPVWRFFAPRPAPIMLAALEAASDVSIKGDIACPPDPDFAPPAFFAACGLASLFALVLAVEVVFFAVEVADCFFADLLVLDFSSVFFADLAMCVRSLSRVSPVPSSTSSMQGLYSIPRLAAISFTTMKGDDPISAGKQSKPPFGDRPIDDNNPVDDIPFDDGVDDDPRDRWDADDERRQHDQMAPPKEPCECYCLHCQRTFTSDQMWFQRVVGDKSGFDGFWMCPTNNCSGAGFTFDIFPTDPDHPANAGWIDDEGDDDYDPEEDEDIEAFDPDDVGNGEEVQGDYDPAESKYKQLDTEMGDADNDISEGDEWKLGLAPGEEVPPQMYWSEGARKEWEAEQADYDAPDRRPRELDWSNRTDRPERGNRGEFGDDAEFKEDDIPF